MIQSTNQKPFFGVNQSTQINGELTIKKQKNIKLRECLFTSKFHEFKSCIYVTINQRLHGWSTRGSQRCRPRWRLNISLQNQSLGGFLHLDIIKHTRFTQKDTLCWSRHKSGHFAFQQHSNIITADLFVPLYLCGQSVDLNEPSIMDVLISRKKEEAVKPPRWDGTNRHPLSSSLSFVICGLVFLTRLQQQPPRCHSTFTYTCSVAVLLKEWGVPWHDNMIYDEIWHHLMLLQQIWKRLSRECLSNGGRWALKICLTCSCREWPIKSLRTTAVWTQQNASSAFQPSTITRITSNLINSHSKGFALSRWCHTQAAQQRH